MARQIQKSYAIAVAVFGVMSLLFGFGVAISSWILKSKTEDISITEGNISAIASTHEAEMIQFNSYWWGGFFYLVPGLLALLAAHTRNTIVMIIYSIFNLICLIASTIACVLVSGLLVFWATIHSLLESSSCHDIPNACICVDSSSNLNKDGMFSILETKCSDLNEINALIMAIVIMVAIATLLAGISGVLSCCALCNKEPHDSVVVSFRAGPYGGGTSIRRGTYQKL